LARGRRGGGGFDRRPFGRLAGGRSAADVARQLGARVSFDDRLMDLRRQLVGGKRAEGAAEGGFAGNFPGPFPAPKLAPQRAGLQGVNERAGGGGIDRRAWR